MTITAIETLYGGILFRSRLEARWAVFFDALGIEWRYEAEGYNLPSGWYLPDFWLPDHGHFEVKGSWPSSDEKQKAEECAQATQRRVYIAPGDIGVRGVFPPSCCASRGNNDGFIRLTALGVTASERAGDWNQWQVCPSCGTIDIGHILCRDLCRCSESLNEYEEGVLFHAPRLHAAYQAARSERFETHRKWRGVSLDYWEVLPSGEKVLRKAGP